MEVDPPEVIVTTGLLYSVTVMAVFAVSEHPLLSVTVTLKFPEVSAMIVCVLAPVDHAYPVYPLPASSVTLPPSQKGVGPLAEMVGVGLLFTASEKEAESEQEFTVTVT